MLNSFYNVALSFTIPRALLTSTWLWSELFKMPNEESPIKDMKFQQNNF